MYLHATGTFTDFDKIGPYWEEEKRVTAELKAEGVFKNVYRRVSDGPGVFVIMEADDVDDAHTQTGRLPFVANGLLKFEFLPVEQLI